MLRSNYRYSRDHQHHNSHHHHHHHHQLTASLSLGGPTTAGCDSCSPVSIFFDEMETQWGEPVTGGAAGVGAAIGHGARQDSLKHLSISALGRHAREGFRRSQTSRDSTAEMSRSFEASVVQQLGGVGGGSSTKLVKVLGEEVKTDDKVLFDHFYDRGRRNAFANIFCGLSSRGLRRLFAVYGIDEVQTKPPPVPPSAATRSPPMTSGTSLMAAVTLSDSHQRERRRHRLDKSASRGGSVESHDSSGGGGGSYRQRAGSANHQYQRQRARRHQLSQHQQLASAAFTLLGCGKSSSADDDRDDADRGECVAAGEDGGATGRRCDIVEDLGVVPSTEPADFGGRLGLNS